MTNTDKEILEDYVSFETAKLLKEKGFDIPCDNYYDSSGKTPNESIYGGVSIKALDYNADPFVKSGFPKLKTFSAPTQSMAMKWLREVYCLFIEISTQHYYNEDHTTYYKWYWNVYFTTNDNHLLKESGFKLNSYEDACEAAIRYCLENLI